MRHTSSLRRGSVVASQSRKHRGYRSQKVVAEWLARHGWPWAESTGAGRSGSDVTGTPGLFIEVKARRGFSPLAWLRQSRLNSTGLPFVVFRCDGQGEANVGEWGVLLRLDDMTELLRSAGYGGPSEGDERPEPHDEDAEDEHKLDSSLGFPAVVAVTHASRVRPQAQG